MEPFMDLQTKDIGVIAVIIKQFQNERYPRMQALQQKVNSGLVLDSNDLSYLEKVFSDAHQLMAVISRHPEYGQLAKKALLMYEEIMSKSQLNDSESSGT